MEGKKKKEKIIYTNRNIKYIPNKDTSSNKKNTRVCRNSKKYAYTVL